METANIEDCSGCRFAEPPPNFPLCHNPAGFWSVKHFNSNRGWGNLPAVRKEMRAIGGACGPDAKLKETTCKS